MYLLLIAHVKYDVSVSHRFLAGADLSWIWNNFKQDGALGISLKKD